jgi:hypothetical protein
MCRKYYTKHKLRRLVLETHDTTKRRKVPDGRNITASSLHVKLVYRTIVWEKPFVPPLVMSYPLVVKKYFRDPQSYSPNPRAVSLPLFHRSLNTASIMASSLAYVRNMHCLPAFKTQSMSQFTSTPTLLLSSKYIGVWMTLTRNM